MLPPQKKAKTGEGESTTEKEEEKPKEDGHATNGEEEAKEPEPPRELEEDATPLKGVKTREKVVFRTEDTTMNVMPSAYGNLLMPLSDGGLQYLLAGARTNVGLKGGRYTFEVKVVEIITPAEDPAGRQKTPMPRSQLRIGVAKQGGSLFLGETADGICFDTEGALIHNKVKKPQVSEKFTSGDVLALVVNLESDKPNSNTISLFKNGVRASQPQTIPAEWKGQVLFPTLTFKNLSLHYNFGPNMIVPLPFKCHMLCETLAKDTQVAAPIPPPKDGKHEVLFPVVLPDEGGFDWLDYFLEQNPHYTEISDRAILSWAEKSGMWRPNGFSRVSSNDKPEMGFGIGMMDDTSIRRALNAVAPVQPRNYIIMEVKANLLKDERKEVVSKWGYAGFKRVASVMLGDPPKVLKQKFQELMQKQKQEASDAEFKARKAEEKKKKLIEKRQKQLDRERKQALQVQKKKQDELKKKIEEEKRKKEAADKGEEVKEADQNDDGDDKNDEERKDDEEEDEEDKEGEDVEEIEEDPPQVELTPEEKKLVFRKNPIPDLTTYNLNIAFTKFSVPEKEEGFDEVKFEWLKAEKCKDYLKCWVQDRKLTTRVEDIQPSEWFAGKWKDWQKVLQQWHAKQNQYKQAVAKKVADKAAKEAAKAAKQALREKMIQEAAARKKAEEEAIAKALAEGKEPPEKKEDEKTTPMEVDEEEEKAAEEEETDNGKPDFDKLDVFGVEDVVDVGGGEPLFSSFGFEDWTMMSLRFELHLLCHAFRRDVNDTDRIGIHLEHLAFYYNKYYKKALNTKFYGVDNMKELVEFIRDTVTINRKNQVVEPQLPDDMESMGVFVMLTEESRRDRNRRVDLGDESARLKLSQPQVGAGLAAVQGPRPVIAGVRPFTAAGASQPAAGAVRPAVQGWAAQQMTARPGFPTTGPATAAFRPAAAFQAGAQARPFQAGWRPGTTWR